MPFGSSFFEARFTRLLRAAPRGMNDHKKGLKKLLTGILADEVGRLAASSVM